MTDLIKTVPTFLLYDGISWCIKNNRAQIRYFRTENGVRNDIIVTPEQMFSEILLRRSGPQHLAVNCAACGALADLGCYFVAEEPLCSPCYWGALQKVREGTPLIFVPDKPDAPTRPKVIVLPVTVEPDKPKGPQEETPEQIAQRLGVSLEELRASGYLD